MRYPLRKQRTIAKTAGIEGFGYFRGRDVAVEFRPAEPDTGIVFVRGDLDPIVRIPAVIGNRIEAPRRTTLRAGGAEVEMVEHLMAALAGLRIDNCEVRVDAAEMPGCDGSSLAATEAISAAGIREQDATRRCLVITRVTRVGNAEAWIEARPARLPGTFAQCYLDFGSKSPIGRQTVSLEITPETFVRQLAPSRTFILETEAKWLRLQGLGQRTTYGDLLVFDDKGPVNNPLRFEDECVRHKMLDLVGDLALAGCDLVGDFVAHRSGHRLNAELVRTLLNQGQVVGQWRRSA